jgi:hypothetical protein
MNYRHAYHAGNFADCFKHALLIALIDSLARAGFDPGCIAQERSSRLLRTPSGGWDDLAAAISK